MCVCVCTLVYEALLVSVYSKMKFGLKKTISKTTVFDGLIVFEALSPVVMQ